MTTAAHHLPDPPTPSRRRTLRPVPDPAPSPSPARPAGSASPRPGQWRGGSTTGGAHVLPSRLLILLVSLATVFLLFSGRVSADQPVVVASHVVERGETLWEIAAGVTEPGEDVRATVAVIRELNELADVTLVPGQRLVVPTG